MICYQSSDINSKTSYMTMTTSTSPGLSPRMGWATFDKSVPGAVAALRSLGRSEDALASYDKAIELRPDFAGAYYNRGNTLHDLRRLCGLSGFWRVMAEERSVVHDDSAEGDG